MTSTVLAISAAYVVIGVLLLTIGLTSRFAWWVKAAAIVVTSMFFVEVFFATKDLLGWPRTGQLPARFQLLWVRVVEPDAKIGDRGAIYLWIEEVDEHNVPDGVPRSYRLPYSRPLADRAAKARDEIMRGRPQQGWPRLGSTEGQPANLVQSGSRPSRRRGRPRSVQAVAERQRVSSAHASAALPPNP